MTALLKGSHNGKKAGKVELNGTERAAFERLKLVFHEAPLLHHFDPQLPIRIETDASNVAMAGILSQPDARGRWHPVAFWSRKFTAAETNYGTPDQEMFAIVMSFKQWRHYVEGQRVQWKSGPTTRTFRRSCGRRGCLAGKHDGVCI